MSAPTFTSHDVPRHAWCHKITALAAQVAHGRAAEAILAQGVGAEPVAVVSLPLWVWRYPVINVGRKGVAEGVGTPLHLPVAVTWDACVALIGPDDELHLTWHAAGMGHTFNGLTDVKAMGRGEMPTTSCDPTTVPSTITSSVVSARRAAALLENMAAEGKNAWWQMYSMMVPLVEKSVSRARASLAASVAAFAGAIRNELVDERAGEDIVTMMTTGDERRCGTVPRLIDALAAPGARFAKVDPNRWVASEIARDARQHVRNAVGDGRAGGKIRDLATKLGTRDAEQVAAAYRAAYPSEYMGVGRVWKALTLAQHQAPSLAWHVDERTCRASHSSFEDEAIEHIDDQGAAAFLAELNRRIEAGHMPVDDQVLRLVREAAECGTPLDAIYMKVAS